MMQETQSILYFILLLTHICSILFFQFTLYFYYILGRQTTSMDMKSLISRASIDYVGRYVSLCVSWWLMSFIIIVFPASIPAPN